MNDLSLNSQKLNICVECTSLARPWSQISAIHKQISHNFAYSLFLSNLDCKYVLGFFPSEALEMLVSSVDETLNIGAGGGVKEFGELLAPHYTREKRRFVCFSPSSCMEVFANMT